jgi:hypothetical protein
VNTGSFGTTITKFLIREMESALGLSNGWNGAQHVRLTIEAAKQRLMTVFRIDMVPLHKLLLQNYK